MNSKNNVLKGRKGEDIAKSYLIKKGYKIVDSNWHYSKNAEIDIIAQKDDVLVFIEVKFRTCLSYGHPFEAVNYSKIEKIHKAMIAYISNSPKKYKNFRFDAIAIIGFENPTVEHIENIGQF